MHETLVQIKDVEFVSYLRPSDLHGHIASLQMSFRLVDMQEDELIIDIQQDEENRLYTTNVDYYEAKSEEQFSLMNELDKEELHELLKAVLNTEETQVELAFYGMSTYTDCYAKCIGYDFEVIVTHTDLNEGASVGDSAQVPMDVHHQFVAKAPAFEFFHTLVQSYKEKATEEKKQNFGTYKLIWQQPKTKHEIMTYIQFRCEGEEIASLDAYNKL